MDLETARRTVRVLTSFLYMFFILGGAYFRCGHSGPKIGAQVPLSCTLDYQKLSSNISLKMPEASDSRGHTGLIPALLPFGPDHNEPLARLSAGQVSSLRDAALRALTLTFA